MESYGKAAMHSHGRVKYAPNLILYIHCPIDVSLFPFDKQICTIQIITWHSPTRIQIFRELPPDYSYPLPTGNSEWDLVSVDTHFYNYSSPGKRDEYSQVNYTVIVKRKPLYYMINVVIPSALVSMLATFTFWLPPESGERIGVGLTTFLAFSVFQLMIADKTPESADIPILCKYVSYIVHHIRSIYSCNPKCFFIY